MAKYHKHKQCGSSLKLGSKSSLTERNSAMKGAMSVISNNKKKIKNLPYKLWGGGGGGADFF
jgi:hypothetical protein